MAMTMVIEMEKLDETTRAITVVSSTATRRSTKAMIGKTPADEKIQFTYTYEATEEAWCESR